MFKLPLKSKVIEQTAFLEDHVFKGLKSKDEKLETNRIQFFSETDFATILERVEHFGIGLYSIDTLLKEKPFGSVKHEEHKKKATDPKWYKKAFLTFKTSQAELMYGATYKVSSKLLARQIEED